MNGFNRLQRFLAGMVMVTFFVTNTLTPAPVAYGQGVESPSVIPPFKIPAEFGKVNDIIPAASPGARQTGEAGLGGDVMPAGQVVIHIQEAHGNYDAQKNIRNILGHLQRNYGVNLILMEGAGNKLTPEMFHFFPQDAVLQQKSNEKLMQAGELTGAEAFLIDQIDGKRELGTRDSGLEKTSDQNKSRAGQAVAYGVEDADTYGEGREAYRKVYEGRKHTEKFLKAFFLQWQKKADRSVGKLLREFLSREIDFEEGRFPLLDWMAFLKVCAARDLKIDLENTLEQKDWPVLVRYFRLKKIGSQIDLAKVESEKREFLKTLQKFGTRSSSLGKIKNEQTKRVPSPESRVPEKVFQEVEAVFEAAKTGNLPAYETRFVFERLMDVLPADFSFEAYPAFRLYLQQMILLSEIQSESLHQEINALSGKVAVALAKTAEEQRMAAVLQGYRLLRKLFGLELSREEYQQLLERKVSPEKILKGLGMRSSGLEKTKNLNQSGVPSLERLFVVAMQFYATAITREDFMMQNALRRIRETKQTRSVLITGGFHTEGFRKRVVASGSSYVGITPAIGEIDSASQKNYLKAFLGADAVSASQQAPLVRNDLFFWQKVAPQSWFHEWDRMAGHVSEIVGQISPAGVREVKRHLGAAAGVRSEVRQVIVQEISGRKIDVILDKGNIVAGTRDELVSKISGLLLEQAGIRDVVTASEKDPRSIEVRGQKMHWNEAGTLEQALIDLLAEVPAVRSEVRPGPKDLNLGEYPARADGALTLANRVAGILTRELKETDLERVRISKVEFKRLEDVPAELRADGAKRFNIGHAGQAIPLSGLDARLQKFFRTADAALFDNVEWDMVVTTGAEISKETAPALAPAGDKKLVLKKSLAATPKAAPSATPKIRPKIISGPQEKTAVKTEIAPKPSSKTQSLGTWVALIWGAVAVLGVGLASTYLWSRFTAEKTVPSVEVPALSPPAAPAASAARSETRAPGAEAFPSHDPTKTEAWKELQKLFEDVQKLHMKDLFSKEPHRVEDYTRTVSLGNGEELIADLSKNRIVGSVFERLLQLAEETEVPRAIKMMFEGSKINETEGRAVLHTALRNFSTDPVLLDGKNVMEPIRKAQEEIRKFSKKVISGEWKGYTGKPITDIVNIGIGGSDLGPVMVTEALKPYQARKDLRVHFVSNVDATHLAETLRGLDHETTLFIITSKQFDTQETLTNAKTAKAWFLSKADDDLALITQHFVAVSTAEERVGPFGIDIKNMFRFWDYVGGRYSLWSSVGLSVACSIGYENYQELLRGAYDMDQHFRTAPLKDNLPVLLALLGIWYNNFFKAQTHAVLPYSQSLHRLPAYLQQLDMESNGKTVSRDGKRVRWQTGPVIWGEPGTNGQHSFFQLIHQGTKLIPADFLLAALSHYPIEDHQDKLSANAFAQPEALMMGQTYEQAYQELRRKGKTEEEAKALAPHQVFEGNHPTNTLLFKKLTPRMLGALIAMYEQKVFVQGVIWNVYSFDQWGVQLGKVLAKKILPQLEAGGEIAGHDASTTALIEAWKKMQGRSELRGFTLAGVAGAAAGQGNRSRSEARTSLAPREEFYQWLFAPGTASDNTMHYVERLYDADDVKYITDPTEKNYRLRMKYLTEDPGYHAWETDPLFKAPGSSVYRVPGRYGAAKNPLLGELRHLLDASLIVAYSQKDGFRLYEKEQGSESGGFNYVWGPKAVEGQIAKIVKTYFEIIGTDPGSDLALVAWKMVCFYSGSKNVKAADVSLSDPQRAIDDWDAFSWVDHDGLDRGLQLEVSREILRRIKEKLGGMTPEQAVIELNVRRAMAVESGSDGRLVKFSAWTSPEGGVQLDAQPVEMFKMTGSKMGSYTLPPHTGPAETKSAIVPSVGTVSDDASTQYPSERIFRFFSGGADVHESGARLFLEMPVPEQMPEKGNEGIWVEELIRMLDHWTGPRGISPQTRLFVPPTFKRWIEEKNGTLLDKDLATGKGMPLGEFLAAVKPVRSEVRELPALFKDVAELQTFLNAYPRQFTSREKGILTYRTKMEGGKVWTDIHLYKELGLESAYGVRLAEQKAIAKARYLLERDSKIMNRQTAEIQDVLDEMRYMQNSGHSASLLGSALNAQGITDLDELCRKPRTEILGYYHVGKGVVADLEEALAAYGRKLGTEASEALSSEQELHSAFLKVASTLGEGELAARSAAESVLALGTPAAADLLTKLFQLSANIASGGVSVPMKVGSLAVALALEATRPETKRSEVRGAFGFTDTASLNAFFELHKERFDERERFILLHRIRLTDGEIWPYTKIAEQTGRTYKLTHASEQPGITGQAIRISEEKILAKVAYLLARPSKIQNPEKATLRDIIDEIRFWQNKSNLGVRLSNMIDAAEIADLKDLRRKNGVDLLRYRNVGKEVIAALREALSEYRLGDLGVEPVQTATPSKEGETPLRKAALAVGFMKDSSRIFEKLLQLPGAVSLVADEILSGLDRLSTPEQRVAILALFGPSASVEALIQMLRFSERASILEWLRAKEGSRALFHTFIYSGRHSEAAAMADAYALAIQAVKGRHLEAVRVLELLVSRMDPAQKHEAFEAILAQSQPLSGDTKALAPFRSPEEEAADQRAIFEAFEAIGTPEAILQVLLRSSTPARAFKVWALAKKEGAAESLVPFLPEIFVKEHSAEAKTTVEFLAPQLSEKSQTELALRLVSRKYAGDNNSPFYAATDSIKALKKSPLARFFSQVFSPSKGWSAFRAKDVDVAEGFLALLRSQDGRMAHAPHAVLNELLREPALAKKLLSSRKDELLQALEAFPEKRLKFEAHYARTVVREFRKVFPEAASSPEVRRSELREREVVKDYKTYIYALLEDPIFRPIAFGPRSFLRGEHKIILQHHSPFRPEDFLDYASIGSLIGGVTAKTVQNYERSAVRRAWSLHHFLTAKEEARVARASSVGKRSEVRSGAEHLYLYQERYGAALGVAHRAKGLEASAEFLGGYEAVLSIVNDPALGDKEKQTAAKMMAYGKGASFRGWQEMTPDQKRAMLRGWKTVGVEILEIQIRAAELFSGLVLGVFGTMGLWWPVSAGLTEAYPALNASPVGARVLSLAVSAALSAGFLTLNNISNTRAAAKKQAAKEAAITASKEPASQAFARSEARTHNVVIESLRLQHSVRGKRNDLWTRISVFGSVLMAGLFSLGQPITVRITGYSFDMANGTGQIDYRVAATNPASFSAVVYVQAADRLNGPWESVAAENRVILPGASESITFSDGNMPPDAKRFHKLSITPLVTPDFETGWSASGGASVLVTNGIVAVRHDNDKKTGAVTWNLSPNKPVSEAESLRLHLKPEYFQDGQPGELQISVYGTEGLREQLLWGNSFTLDKKSQSVSVPLAALDQAFLLTRIEITLPRNSNVQVLSVLSAAFKPPAPALSQPAAAIQPNGEATESRSEVRGGETLTRYSRKVEGRIQTVAETSEEKGELLRVWRNFWKGDFLSASRPDLSQLEKALLKATDRVRQSERRGLTAGIVIMLGTGIVFRFLAELPAVSTALVGIICAVTMAILAGLFVNATGRLLEEARRLVMLSKIADEIRGQDPTNPSSVQNEDPTSEARSEVRGTNEIDKEAIFLEDAGELVKRLFEGREKLRGYNLGSRLAGHKVVKAGDETRLEMIPSDIKADGATSLVEELLLGKRVKGQRLGGIPTLKDVQFEGLNPSPVSPAAVKPVWEIRDLGKREKRDLVTIIDPKVAELAAMVGSAKRLAAKNGFVVVSLSKQLNDSVLSNGESTQRVVLKRVGQEQEKKVSRRTNDVPIERLKRTLSGFRLVRLSGRDPQWPVNSSQGAIVFLYASQGSRVLEALSLRKVPPVQWDEVPHLEARQKTAAQTRARSELREALIMAVAMFGVMAAIVLFQRFVVFPIRYRFKRLPEYILYRDAVGSLDPKKGQDRQGLLALRHILRASSLSPQKIREKHYRDRYDAWTESLSEASDAASIKRVLESLVLRNIRERGPQEPVYFTVPDLGYIPLIGEILEILERGDRELRLSMRLDKNSRRWILKMWNREIRFETREETPGALSPMSGQNIFSGLKKVLVADNGLGNKVLEQLVLGVAPQAEVTSAEISSYGREALWKKLRKESYDLVVVNLDLAGNGMEWSEWAKIVLLASSAGQTQTPFVLLTSDPRGVLVQQIRNEGLIAGLIEKPMTTVDWNGKVTYRLSDQHTQALSDFLVKQGFKRSETRANESFPWIEKVLVTGNDAEIIALTGLARKVFPKAEITPVTVNSHDLKPLAEALDPVQGRYNLVIASWDTSWGRKEWGHLGQSLIARHLVPTPIVLWSLLARDPATKKNLEKMVREDVIAGFFEKPADLSGALSEKYEKALSSILTRWSRSEARQKTDPLDERATPEKLSALAETWTKAGASYSYLNGLIDTMKEKQRSPFENRRLTNTMYQVKDDLEELVYSISGDNLDVVRARIPDAVRVLSGVARRMEKSEAMRRVAASLAAGEKEWKQLLYHSVKAASFSDLFDASDRDLSNRVKQAALEATRRFRDSHARPAGAEIRGEEYPLFWKDLELVAIPEHDEELMETLGALAEDVFLDYLNRPFIVSDQPLPEIFKSRMYRIYLEKMIQKKSNLKFDASTDLIVGYEYRPGDGPQYLVLFDRGWFSYPGREAEHPAKVLGRLMGGPAWETLLGDSGTIRVVDAGAGLDYGTYSVSGFIDKGLDVGIPQEPGFQVLKFARLDTRKRMEIGRTGHPFVTALIELTKGNPFKSDKAYVDLIAEEIGAAHRLPGALKELLQEITCLSPRVARQEFAGGIRAVMNFVTFLEPELLEEMKGWDPFYYEQLRSFLGQPDYQEFFKSGEILIHKTDPKTGFSMSRRLGTRTLFSAIHFSKTPHNVRDGKSWFRTLDPGEAGIQNASQVWYVVLDALKDVSYGIRPGDSFFFSSLPGWHNGVPVLEGGERAQILEVSFLSEYLKRTVEKALRDQGLPFPVDAEAFWIRVSVGSQEPRGDEVRPVLEKALRDFRQKLREGQGLGQGTDVLRWTINDHIDLGTKDSRSVEAILSRSEARGLWETASGASVETLAAAAGLLGVGVLLHYFSKRQAAIAATFAKHFNKEQLQDLIRVYTRPELWHGAKESYQPLMDELWDMFLENDLPVSFKKDERLRIWSIGGVGAFRKAIAIIAKEEKAGARSELRSETQDEAAVRGRLQKVVDLHPEAGVRKTAEVFLNSELVSRGRKGAHELSRAVKFLDGLNRSEAREDTSVVPAAGEDQARATKRELLALSDEKLMERLSRVPKTELNERTMDRLGVIIAFYENDEHDGMLAEQREFVANAIMSVSGEGKTVSKGDGTTPERATRRLAEKRVLWKASDQELMTRFTAMPKTEMSRQSLEFMEKIIAYYQKNGLLLRSQRGFIVNAITAQALASQVAPEKGQSELSPTLESLYLRSTAVKTKTGDYPRDTEVKMVLLGVPSKVNLSRRFLDENRAAVIGILQGLVQTALGVAQAPGQRISFWTLFDHTPRPTLKNEEIAALAWGQKLGFWQVDSVNSKVILIEQAAPEVKAGAKVMGQLIDSGTRIICSLGAPGSGKGTLLEWLVPELNKELATRGVPKGYKILTVSDHLKPVLQAQFPEEYEKMKSGQLVSDGIIIQVINSVLAREEYSQAYGIIFDGFPRTGAQWARVGELLWQGKPVVPDMHIIVDAPDEVLFERMAGRIPEDWAKNKVRADAVNAIILHDGGRVTVDREALRTVYDNRMKDYNADTAPMIEMIRQTQADKTVAVASAEKISDTRDRFLENLEVFLANRSETRRSITAEKRVQFKNPLGLHQRPAVGLQELHIAASEDLGIVVGIQRVDNQEYAEFADRMRAMGLGVEDGMELIVKAQSMFKVRYEGEQAVAEGVLDIFEKALQDTDFLEHFEGYDKYHDEIEALQSRYHVPVRSEIRDGEEYALRWTVEMPLARPLMTPTEFQRVNRARGGGSEQAVRGVSEKIMDGIYPLLANTLNAIEQLIPAASRLAVSQKVHATAARRMLGITKVQDSDVFILDAAFALDKGGAAVMGKVLNGAPIAVLVREGVQGEQDIAFINEHIQPMLAAQKQAPVLIARTLEEAKAELASKVRTQKTVPSYKALVMAAGTMAAELTKQLGDDNVVRVTDQMYNRFLNQAGQLITSLAQTIQAQFALARSA